MTQPDPEPRPPSDKQRIAKLESLLEDARDREEINARNHRYFVRMLWGLGSQDEDWSI